MFRRTLWMPQNGSSPLITCSVKNLTYSLLGCSETHGDERFRSRLKAQFSAVQIPKPTDVLQEPGQCSHYSAQTVGWTVRVSNPDRGKKLMLLQNAHIGSASYLISSGNSFSREKVAEEWGWSLSPPSVKVTTEWRYVSTAFIFLGVYRNFIFHFLFYINITLH
jgi:hypothetical protein